MIIVTTEPIKVEIVLKDIKELESTLEFVELERKKHPNMVLTIRVLKS